MGLWELGWDYESGGDAVTREGVLVDGRSMRVLSGEYRAARREQQRGERDQEDGNGDDGEGVAAMEISDGSTPPSSGRAGNIKI